MPADEDELFCRLHVDCPEGRDRLAAEVAALTGGTIERGGVRTVAGKILVEDADDYSPGGRLDFPQGFLFFPHQVEPLWGDDVSLDDAVALVGRLLDGCWRQGWPAVAVCDYEDRLPHAGGYASRDVPWPAP
jgi:hypothetical protein